MTTLPPIYNFIKKYTKEKKNGFSLKNDKDAFTANFILKHNIPFGEDFTKICDAIYKDKQEISVSFDDDKTSTVIASLGLFLICKKLSKVVSDLTAARYLPF